MLKRQGASKAWKVAGRVRNEVRERKLREALVSELHAKRERAAGKEGNVAKSVLRMWDSGGDGRLSLGEFQELLSSLSVADRFDDEDVNELFMSFDGDGSGQMDLKELERLLEKPDDSVVSVASTQAKLRETLRQQASRVIDLFKSSDVDGDGEISRKEFRRTLGLMGISVPGADSQATYDSLFDAFDLDGSGSITFRELHKMLRAQKEVKKKKVKKVRTVVAADPDALRQEVLRDCLKFSFALSDAPVRGRRPSLDGTVAAEVVEETPAEKAVRRRMSMRRPSMDAVAEDALNAARQSAAAAEARAAAAPIGLIASEAREAGETAEGRAAGDDEVSGGDTE